MELNEIFKDYRVIQARIKIWQQLRHETFKNTDADDEFINKRLLFASSS